MTKPTTHFRISPRAPGIGEQIRELVGARDLFWQLLAREVRTRYTQTALGIVWVVLQPLLPAVIFAVVFGNFARLPSAGTPYLLFALSGIVIYGLFAGAANRAATAFMRDGQLVTKVYFPRAVLPLASGIAAIVDFAVGLVVLVALQVALGGGPGPALLALPILVGAALTLGLGLGLAVAALSARYRDFAIALPFALQVLLYASPVVYSIELIPESMRGIYGLNPLVGLIDLFRWAVLNGLPPSVEGVASGVVVGTLCVVIGVLVFSRASRDLADVI